MESGDYTTSRTDTWELEELSKITDRNFMQVTFSTRPALVTKQLVNGYRQTKDYHGGPYDELVFDLVEGTWDHEHCSVCFFKIVDGHTYWENRQRIVLLCDACYEAYQKYSEHGSVANPPKMDGRPRTNS